MDETRPYRTWLRGGGEIIDIIEIPPPTDKRTFSISAAMQMFEDPRTVSGYQIELFETPTDQVIADNPLGRYALLASLQDTLLSLGAGARTLVSGRIGRTPVLEFQITKSEERALVDNRLGIARHDVTPVSRGAPLMSILNAMKLR